MSPVVVVMLKEPVPGRVKTRLAAAVGEEEACRIYRGLVERQLSVLPQDWEREICFAPDNAEAAMRAWLGSGWRYHAQSGGDLGERMWAAVERNRPDAERPVILLGGDCPYVDQDIMKQCRERLENHELVIGPSLDGGYYLLGLKKGIPELFRNMSWSTDVVLAETLRRAGQMGISAGLLPELEDVDEVEAWDRDERSFKFEVLSFKKLLLQERMRSLMLILR
ncbi:MAG: glycosyltransferase [Blastochloris sp.]|nr:glycosyltransferase [Blastochloris sp.]